MRLVDICIRRPVTTVMLIGFLVVLGLFSYRRLAVDLYPNIDFPIVTVTTTLTGASVEEMESGVTKPIEEAINTIEGIDELRSETHEGLSRDHRILRPRAQQRGGRPGRARQGRRHRVAPPRGHRSAGGGEVRHREHADSQHGGVRQPRPARGHGDRPQADQGGHRDPARRRLGDPGRRPGAGDQHRSRHRQSGRLRPLDRPGEGGDPRPEHRGAGRPRGPGQEGADPAHDGPHRARRGLLQAHRRQRAGPAADASATSAASRTASSSPATGRGWTASRPSRCCCASRPAPTPFR